MDALNINIEPQETFAMVELMGHQQMVGKITEVTIAGKGFLRIACFDSDGNINFTRDINPDSIYAINPISREACLLFARKRKQQPVVPYEIQPANLLPANFDIDYPAFPSPDEIEEDEL